MADNVAVSAGTGTSVATDQVGADHYQRVKITDGTADSSTHLMVKAEDAAHTTGDTGIMILAVRNDTLAALATTDGDYAPIQVDANGALFVNASLSSITAGTNVIGQTLDAGAGWTQLYGLSGVQFTSADASTAAAVTDAPTGGQKLVIDDIIWSTDTALTINFEIETAETVYFTTYCAANTVYQITPRGKFKLPTADKKLMIDASGAGNISCLVFYHSEA